MIVVFALVLASGLIALMVLTAVGARTRGSSITQASLAGLFFPVTWTAWYLRDEHPYAAQD